MALEKALHADYNVSPYVNVFKSISRHACLTESINISQGKSIINRVLCEHELHEE